MKSRTKFTIAAALPLLIQGCAGEAKHLDAASTAYDVTQRASTADQLGSTQHGNVRTVTREKAHIEEPGFVAGLFGAQSKRVTDEIETYVISDINTAPKNTASMPAFTMQDALKTPLSYAPQQP